MYTQRYILRASYLFLREIDHVGGEKGLAVLLEVCLIGIHHAICQIINAYTM